MLLAERFVPGLGWLQAALLAGYAGLLAGRMRNERQARQIRPWIWRLFSLVFFTQLSLGLLGIDECLMTGKLHFPIPALIVGGPVYRGEGFFMPILFASTLLLVGPAWCSHLCYIGSWDDLASRAKRRPAPLWRFREPIRIGMLLLVIGVALGLRLFEAPLPWVAGAAAAFGILGVLVMLALSTRKGAMVHCTTWCPIGLLADLVGKLSPFRLRIRQGCNDCGACVTVCRYDALQPKDLSRGKPGLTCTLCGDCIGRCKDRLIEYRYLGLSGRRARNLFLVLVVSLHAVFLGVARI